MARRVAKESSASQPDAGEGFGFAFPGRAQAEAAAVAPPRGRLVGDTRRTAAAVTLVEGDNLDALALLEPRYGGRIDAIYIDPPYNRGRDFVYRGIYAEPARAFEIGRAHV